MREAGVYPDVSWEEYTSWPAERSSVLTKVAKSPRHAYAAMMDPGEPTPAMELGTALHMAILEPKRFEAEYAVPPKVDRRTREGKATWNAFIEEHADKTHLSHDKYQACLAARHAVWREPWAEALLAGQGYNELSALWVDPESKLTCKLRADRLAGDFEGSPVILDIKSCTDASKDAFARSIARYDYHVQSALYRDGFKALRDHYRRPMWLAVETYSPYCAALYEPSDEMLEEGQRRYRAALLTIRECRDSGVWPGYDSGVRMLDLPAWAKPDRFEEDEF